MRKAILPVNTQHHGWRAAMRKSPRGRTGVQPRWLKADGDGQTGEPDVLELPVRSGPG